MAAELPLWRLTITALTAVEAASEIARGAISAEDYTRACLERIAAVDSEVHAFVHLDPEHALAQARALDRSKASGERTGPLHGIPVGIKDIFDTADYPTECGSPIFAGRRPDADCAAVRKLREAGAVIIGKTVTTEFAYFHPGQDAKSARPEADAGRLIVRVGRGGGGRHGAVGDRIADQWIDDPSGRILRRVRDQAEPWIDLARRRVDVIPQARSCRRLRTLG